MNLHPLLCSLLISVQRRSQRVRYASLRRLPSSVGGLLLSASLALNASAQSFVSGSNGSYGPLHITADTTLEMPPDGRFHCTTITIANGATLRFTPNARNTPVRLLATGDVVISGIIDLNGGNGTALRGGFGGPGGFAGGYPGRADLPPSSGSGPGGGPTNLNSSGVRHAVFAFRPINAQEDLAQPYGNALLLPLIGGSGGGGSPSDGGGGGGGGAVLIASSTLIRVEGQILAEGGYNGTGSVRSVGSGGAIRLVAPKVMGTAGSALSVRSSTGDYHGRIRIDSVDRTQLDFQYRPIAAVSVGAFMTLAPPVLPRIDLVRAAGQDIAADSGPVYLELPFGSPASQEIEVQARDFQALVPIRVRLVPEAGAALEYPLLLDNRTENPVRGTVSVNVPPNVRTAIEVWTAPVPATP